MRNPFGWVPELKTAIKSPKMLRNGSGWVNLMSETTKMYRISAGIHWDGSRGQKNGKIGQICLYPLFLILRVVGVGGMGEAA